MAARSGATTMAITGLPQPVARFTRTHPRWLAAIGFTLLAAVMIGIWFIGADWPFRYRIIHPELEDMFGSQVIIQHYSRTYFPNPGFVADGLTLRRPSDVNKPIGTIQQLIVQGHWMDLFFIRRRLQLVEIKNMHLILPPPGSSTQQKQFPSGSSSDFTGPSTPIQTLEITDSLLEIQRAKGGSFRFPVRELHIENLHRGQAMTYAVDMQNAVPSGHIRASGRFGPLNPHNLAATPLSGQFQFTQIRLDEFGKIHGTGSAFGRFQGRLGAMETSASVNTPNFSVSNGQPVPLNGHLDCTVNGLTGDVDFHQMDARSENTLVEGRGTVSGSPKSTHLDLRVTHGRAEDLLRPFLHKPPPISGPVALHATAYIAPQNQGSFLQRLQVDGAFDIPSEQVTDPAVEKKLSAFSQRAQDHDPPDSDDPGYADIPNAISSIAGPAVIRKGVVSTRNLIFEVAGAQARLSGTFDFQTQAAHLHGDLRMKADVSHATTGWKSVLLKPFAPFFHHKHAGAVVPIAVTGTPGHYSVGQNIFH